MHEKRSDIHITLGADMLVQRLGDMTALRDKAEIPGFGVLPVNAFVLHAAQPMLIDTGMPVSRAEFLDALGSAIAIADIRWIWLSHPDRAHMGSLLAVLAPAPTWGGCSTYSLPHQRRGWSRRSPRSVTSARSSTSHCRGCPWSTPARH